MRRTLLLFAVVGSLVVPASPAAAGDTVCIGVLGPIVVDNLIVPPGQICELEGTTVLGSATAFEGSALGLFPANIVGNVKLLPRARFIADASEVGGNIECDGCQWADASASRIGGNFHVKAELEGSFLAGNTIGGHVRIVESAPGRFSFDILGNVIHGGLHFEKNTSGTNPTTIDGNDIGGTLQIAENRSNGISITNNSVGDNLYLLKTGGPSEISANRVRQNLKCTENVPPPAGTGNVAQKKEDQCAIL